MSFVFHRRAVQILVSQAEFLNVSAKMFSNFGGFVLEMVSQPNTPPRGIWPKELILHPSAPQINFCSSPVIHCCVTSLVLPLKSLLDLLSAMQLLDSDWCCVRKRFGTSVRMIEERELVVGHISMCLSILMLILSWDEAQSSQANNGNGARKSALQSSRP